jgi:hypothetical protein
MLGALSTSLTETFSLVIKSFRLSSLFPALCFVWVNYFFFLPRLLEALGMRLENGNSIPLLFLLTALIGYTLNYLNFPLIYLAEGYPFRKTEWGRFMISWYDARRDWLKQQCQDSLDKDHLSDCFPPEKKECAPTALGNVMLAFETYPPERYGIDAVYMWPRLLPVLREQKYAVFVEREKEGFDFFLNFAVLSGVLAVESVLLRLFLEQLLFTWVALVSVCAAFSFYQAAIRCAIQWGETVKTAFDLYRYQLAEKLALDPFVDKIDETEKWEDVSYFIKHDSGEEFGAFHYPQPREKKSATLLGETTGGE